VRALFQRPREAAMKKVKLEVEKLVIESFETGRDADGRGTVFGNVKVTDIRYCGSGQGCYTDNEPECQTQWSGCPGTPHCSNQPCQTIEGVDCY
jgi:hypothetical protein